jgi:hypothetical protein
VAQPVVLTHREAPLNRANLAAGKRASLAHERPRLNGPVLGVIPVEHLFARILVDILLVPQTFALSVR